MAPIADLQRGRHAPIWWRALEYAQRRAPIRRAAVPQLAVDVVAPGPQRPVLLYRHSVGNTCGHGRETRADLHRRAPIRRGAVTQLAVDVVAPGPQRPVRLYRHSVVTTCDGREARADLHRRAPIRRGAVTQLAVGVVAPGPQRPVRLYRHTTTDRSQLAVDVSSQCSLTKFLS